MTLLTRADAAKELLLLTEASSSFAGWIAFRHPTWSLAPFQALLVHLLDLLERRELYNDSIAVYYGAAPSPSRHKVYNLMVNMPPRHAKSTFCTVEFPSYFEARNPCRYTMSTSYNSELATDFGREVRNILTDPSTKRVFPDLDISADSRAVDKLSTTAGGAYYAIGMNGSTSGRPANALIVDDPIKSREEADSPTNRRKVWNYYVSALESRLQPEENGEHPIQLVVLTRWHPDDLGGRLMKTDDWKEGRWLHVEFPSYSTVTIANNLKRCDLPPDHDLYVPPNKLKDLLIDQRTVTIREERALWPERFPLEWLKRKERMSPRDFAALYQQRPYIDGGNIVRSDWWRYYQAPCDDYASIVITADTAFKTGEQNDYSVFMVGGLTPSGDMHILNIVRGRWAYSDLKSRAITLCAFWRGRGFSSIQVEDKASGQSLIQDLRSTPGISVIARQVGDKDKVARITSISDIIQGGRVYLPSEADWLDDFLLEVESFPSSTNDDQVDALYLMISALARISLSPDLLGTTVTVGSSLNNLNRSIKSAESTQGGIDTGSMRNDKSSFLNSLRSVLSTSSAASGTKRWGE